MRALTFLGVAGLVLVGLFFVADATLEKTPPVIVTSQRSGLPEPTRHFDEVKVLTSAPAPAPDMTSHAVLVAQPKPAAEFLPKIEPAARAARAEASPENRFLTQDHVQRSNPVDRFSIKGQ
jgi:hypothetical protein